MSDAILHCFIVDVSIIGLFGMYSDWRVLSHYTVDIW